MSDATVAGIEAAIAAHVADQSPGTLLTQWAIVAAAALPKAVDRTRYVCSYSHAPIHSQRGLVRELLADIEEDQEEA